ncbi:ComEA family DNA-binding protein [Undibacterium terreum]|uniref:Helix-hairpin-helix motif-containing protein n=1 Tax=Undibacterium terreum TaxID=1224302 RepID=A0A916V1C6_9BURK|nr:helix-hairpin-helix domain-containing protein [Undibacterium terreum]GGC99595.1 hypothetical protein GCM10011396_53890 [Undibacterium terreum]
MNRLLKSMLLTLGVSLMFAGAAQAADKKASAPASAAAPASASASAPAKTELLDINSASKKELSALPKIGDVRSDAIIKGRPYNGKDDLLNKKIIPEDVYNGIKDMIIAKQKTKKK